ncbi:2Fe-2S iron-sulfur cluster binding domain-containing protein [Modicisalibacter ilicicola DSM 19980]|uniref:2Fe-2S iron-sulfur cluster binding domain-containing protein n=1 Tax=Modicisalibacter ilicicola DSM 19980 TaxID=1121942 RepID=A0A1M5DUN1_9GAMM|nr:(2Fe-2S)-binding protein [Halomonas ilicicola]SHF70574.1 2Fe-2S iron-sulfur cluster binding domain-containing protein [Halomonas ilicicola DSM 19980]
MFQRLDTAATPTRHVQVWLDGEPHRVAETLTVAAAVLQLRGWQGYRRHVDGTPRAPLCMMGVCQECLITIDGCANRQGCLEPVAEGMRIERQGGDIHDG